MRKGQRFIALLLLVVCILAVALSGCAGDKTDVDSDTTDNLSSDQQTADGNSEPIEGGQINVGILQDLDSSLDPHEMVSAGTAGTREVLFNVFEGLVKVDSKGNLVEAVAESYEISDDGTTYTFTLRENVLFHNGDTVTAEDVVYSINRCADASSETTYVSAFSSVNSVEATDDRTVVIKLVETDIEFLAYLTAAIIPADYGAQATAPVGTGPFRFVSRSVQENAVIERFNGYWGEKAYLDRVTYKIYADADTLVMALGSGAVDICAHLTSDQANELGSAFNVLEGSMNLVQALYLNNAAEPFDNALVRQALCYAVDVQEIMDILADGRGVPVGSSMYPAFTKYFAEELAGRYPHDPDKAIALLNQAGYPDGFSMTITVASNYLPHVNTAQVLVEQLKAVGISASIQLVEWNTWLEEVYTGRNYEATVVGVDSVSFTAQGMLSRFVSTDGKNFIGFSDDQYDAVYAEARTQTDDMAQVKLYKELQTILSEKAASVYLQDLCDLVAVNAKLGGYEFYPIYVMDMSKIYYVA